MRWLFFLAIFCIAAPASAQEQGVFIFDFDTATSRERSALARQVVEDAEGIAEAAAIYCSTNPWADGARQRQQLRAMLLEADSATTRLFDAGFCTPEITGRANDDIGEDRIWLALTNVPFLERYRRERLGY